MPQAVYSEALSFGKNTTNKPLLLVDLIEELDGKLTGKPFYKIESIIFQTLDGDDVKTPDVVLELA